MIEVASYLAFTFFNEGSSDSKCTESLKTKETRKREIEETRVAEEKMKLMKKMKDCYMVLESQVEREALHIIDYILKSSYLLF